MFTNPPWGWETPDTAGAGEKGFGGTTAGANGCGILGLAAEFVGYKFEADGLTDGFGAVCWCCTGNTCGVRTAGPGYPCEYGAEAECSCGCWCQKTETYD